jgi:hypothetical protein
MFSALLCLLASSAILFYVLRFRVHVHVTYAPTTSRRCSSSSPARKRGTATETPRQTATVPQSLSGRRAEAEGTDARLRYRASEQHGPEDATAMTRPVQTIEDIASGLVNLGAQKRPALLAARKAVRDYPDADFDIQFSIAIQEVRAA